MATEAGCERRACVARCYACLAVLTALAVAYAAAPSAAVASMAVLWCALLAANACAYIDNEAKGGWGR